MRWCVFDFETNGLNSGGKENGYKPLPEEELPLPWPNYPTQLAARVVDDTGKVYETYQTLIRGATRLAPWVVENCTHLTLKKLERQGVEFSEALTALSKLIETYTEEEEEDTASGGTGSKIMLVAHNIKYDWEQVLLPTTRQLGLSDHPAFLHLQSLPRGCTCINQHRMNDRSAYYWHKVQDTRGPRLAKLCESLGIEFEEDAAHDAQYDVLKTSECLVAMYAKGERL